MQIRVEDFARSAGEPRIGAFVAWAEEYADVFEALGAPGIEVADQPCALPPRQGPAGGSADDTCDVPDPAGVVTLGFVLDAQAAFARASGGITGLRDAGALESALAQPQQVLFGQELYPERARKAARYAFGIVAGHPFLDGNKRVGLAALARSLDLAGADFRPGHRELLDTMLSLAAGTLGYERLAAWVESQTER